MKKKNKAKFISMILILFFLTSITTTAYADDFLIGAFWLPTWSYTNSTQYDYLMDANINYIENVPVSDLNTVQRNNTILNLCSTRGIKMQVADSRFTNLDTATDTQIDAIANDYKDNPALGGYYVLDEPNVSKFTGLAHAYNRFLYNSPNSIPYVNLFPTYAYNEATGALPVLSISQQTGGSGYTVTSSNPLGQTFTTPSDCYFIDSIQLNLDNSQWSTDEQLTLTLWDSPSKALQIAAYQLSGTNNSYYPNFYLNTGVSPSSSYYWELTHNGGGNNSVGWIISSPGNSYSGGSAYESGLAQSNDFYFKLYRGRSSKDKSVSQLSTGGGSFVTSTSTLGQTFKTPANLERRLQFVEIYLDIAQWSSNEYLTLTVYDSQSKNQILGKTTMNTTNNRYFPRFYVNASLQPNTSYYWELTHNGGGDNSVGWVCQSTSNAYSDGAAYVNNSAQTFDFYFRTVYIKLYQDYLEEWVDAVGASNLKYLGYGFYPYEEGQSGIKLDYFLNLEYVRDMGLKKNVKTACYLQAVGISDKMRRPNQNELRYNVFTCLAYGIKQLNWFTWWTPIGQNETFTNSIIDTSGNKTDLYTPVQTLNSQVKAWGPTLMSLTSQAVYHSGVLETGTSSVPNNFWWKSSSSNDNIIISYFKNSSNRKYIMIVNRDLLNTNNYTFNISPKPTAITEISKSTGQEINTSYNSSTGALTVTSMAPGEGRLYALPSGY